MGPDAVGLVPETNWPPGGSVWDARIVGGDKVEPGSGRRRFRWLPEGVVPWDAVAVGGPEPVPRAVVAVVVIVIVAVVWRSRSGGRCSARRWRWCCTAGLAAAATRRAGGGRGLMAGLRGGVGEPGARRGGLAAARAAGSGRTRRYRRRPWEGPGSPPLRGGCAGRHWPCYGPPDPMLRCRSATSPASALAVSGSTTTPRRTRRDPE